VLDQDEESPVHSVEVRIRSIAAPGFVVFHRSTHALGDGIELPLPRGDLSNWILQVWAPGYTIAHEELSDFYEEDRTEPYCIYLGRGRIYRGRLLDRRGRPTPGCEVDADPCSTAWTDARGEYCVGVIEEDVEEHGRLDLDAESPGLGTARLAVDLHRLAGDRLPDLVLRGKGVLRGRLLLSNGRALAGFEVEAIRLGRAGAGASGFQRGETTTNALGVFEMCGLMPGRFDIKVGLADVEHRTLRTISVLRMRHPQHTGSSLATYWFQPLEVETLFPVVAKEKEVEARLELPGSGSGDYLSWEPISRRESRTLPLQVGTRLELTALVPGGAWASRRLVTEATPGVRRVRLFVPALADWVPVRLKLQAPALHKSHSVLVSVLTPHKEPRYCEIREAPRGTFHFRIPPGQTQLQFELRARVAGMACGNYRPHRERKPERVNIEGWLPEERLVTASPGVPIRLDWTPRPGAAVSFAFVVEGKPKELLDPVRVSIVSLASEAPRSMPHRLRRSGTYGPMHPGEAKTWRGLLPQGKTRLRFEVGGYEPALQDLQLRAGIDLLTRVKLRRLRTPELGSEPYRCGRTH